MVKAGQITKRQALDQLTRLKKGANPSPEAKMEAFLKSGRFAGEQGNKELTDYRSNRWPQSERDREVRNLADFETMRDSNAAAIDAGRVSVEKAAKTLVELEKLTDVENQRNQGIAELSLRFQEQAAAYGAASAEMKQLIESNEKLKKQVEERSKAMESWLKAFQEKQEEKAAIEFKTKRKAKEQLGESRESVRSLNDLRAMAAEIERGRQREMRDTEFQQLKLQLDELRQTLEEIILKCGQSGIKSSIEPRISN